MKYRMTPIGKMVGLTIFFFYWASMTSQSGLLLFLVGIILGCFVLNGFRARKHVLQIELCPPKTTGMEEGGKAEDPWLFTNKNNIKSGMIKILGKDQVWIRQSSIGAGETVKSIPLFSLTRRGVYHFQDTGVSCAYPFGLIEVIRTVSLPGELVVYPAIYHVNPPPRAAGFDLTVGGKHKGIRHSTSGADFAGVRPIQHGDPLKQIHWRSSAKGQGLMVKIFEEELSGRISVLLDTRDTGNIDVFDNALRAAGSIMNAALDEGNHVEWIDLSKPQLQLVPPLSDGIDLLFGLARLQPINGDLPVEKIYEVIHQISRKSAVHLFLTKFDESILEALNSPQWNKRSITCYLPQGSDISHLDTISVVFYGPKGLFPKT